jgi:hypothetical protein
MEKQSQNHEKYNGLLSCFATYVQQTFGPPLIGILNPFIPEKHSSPITDPNMKKRTIFPYSPSMSWRLSAAIYVILPLRLAQLQRHINPPLNCTTCTLEV